MVIQMIDSRQIDEGLVKGNRKYEAELLREVRMKNTQRSFICYGLFTLFALNTLFTLSLILLLGLGYVLLSDKIIITLIIETVAHGAAMFFTVIKSLFYRVE